MIELAGWGRYPRHASEMLSPTLGTLPRLMRDGTGLVARGNGRAYGDAAIGESLTLSTRCLDRIRAFDRTTGLMRVEAGVLLSDILALAAPLGFFPPVVPGTKFVRRPPCVTSIAESSADVKARRASSVDVRSVL